MTNERLSEMRHKGYITNDEYNELKQKVGRCKDCKYFGYHSIAKLYRIPAIVEHEICSKWGDSCKTREDGYCHLFEKTEEVEEW